MPRRNDLRSILIIGAGPIIIGQACEFDYSGTQAAKALRADGFRVVLVNSNPATIMTDPETADATYIEPLTAESLTAIIDRERPDAVLSTMGGQTALNLTKALHEAGILERFGVEILGAKIDAIRKGEDREAFREVCRSAGIDVPRAEVVRTVEEGIRTAEAIGFPIVLRPAFTLGGTGSGVAKNVEELRSLLAIGLAASPTGEVLAEEYLFGWKEFELEVMRDAADRCVVICAIENIDPMGVHTGDSITVAPALTLPDDLYQKMRNDAFAILRGVGVETGGSNVQFALDPRTDRIVAIEMNPRVSRSSALASKATGFPIAKIAALLAVGYLLDEIPNDITRKTKAAFEPALDYVVTKIPRFAFEKFKDADQTLTTSMKSVGEVMAIGRTFPESLQKAVRGLEIGRLGLAADGKGLDGVTREMMKRDTEDAERKKHLADVLYKIKTPNCDRLFNIKYALMMDVPADEIARLSGIDVWFIRQIDRLVEFEKNPSSLGEGKRLGYSDAQLEFLGVHGNRPRRVYKSVDTCAGEFAAETPYYYGTFGDECEARPTNRPSVMILGSGPNRIGQGIEFDCCCCHAAASLRRDGYDVVMVNSNPETVSTDYDTSDRLFFEPVVVEDVIDIYETMRPQGAIVSLGGQTPLSIAHGIEKRGAKILGTSVDSIDRAEDRERFSEVLRALNLQAPPHATVTTIDEAVRVAESIGYPILVRPSYVLGGRAMQVARSTDQLRALAAEALEASDNRPLLIDRYLEDAIETDVDALCDGERTVIIGVMEHVEPAGVHSGDSAGIFPPYTLDEPTIELMRDATRSLARALDVRGLINVQFAVQNGVLYILEVNPRASRTVPFFEKATGVQWAGEAARIMMGKTINELGLTDGDPRGYIFAKEVVLPFNRFENVDPVLSPEMKSTGEVMGIGRTFPEAYLKAQLGAGNRLPKSGGILVNTSADISSLIERLRALGYTIHCSESAEKIVAGEIALIINTCGGRIDRAAIRHQVPAYSTVRSAEAAVAALEYFAQNPETQPVRLQDLKSIRDLS